MLVKSINLILDKYRKFISMFFSFCLLILLLIYSQMAFSQSVPNDLSIDLSSAPRMPGRTNEVESLSITANGTVNLSVMNARGGDLPQATIQIDNDALGRIYQAIMDHGYFTLKEEYSDPSVRDGDYASLTITAGGDTHSVRTINIRLVDFDQIVLAINREMPDGRRIIYNALHVTEYGDAER